MSATEMLGHRAQILANAKIMLKPTLHSTPANGNNGTTPYHNGGSSGGSASQSTLSPPTNYYGDLDVVVFGSGDKFTAAVMAGLIPAIEGAPAPSPEAAVRKLFTATAELLNNYIPKVGAHQRNIHGGGVFDEDLISGEIIEARNKS